MDAQLKKGFLEILVLASLKFKASYGYKIIQDISQVFEISESTLYPILKRLEAQGLVTTYTEEHQSRLRRYYRITEEGRVKLSESQADFEEIKLIYQYILRKED
ncbi:MAG TPA: PadR family transcriptional regulator [Bacilli bacterium]|jgi:PadR family transcriptional regulator PadR|nr:MAG: lineage-specific thermal regulator protein [Tenericutes bacterium ADurb.Bin140]HOE77322.1 PadR family transcriptional regulator [Bacilli bacterium]HON63658.1 PadR family transcriptional regulator [Bacilli bacterium]HOR96300.1 PadR family transcriptional regulator [Bacilli bacterium]HPD11902.1 PadR family transcriptional regulator [Bacilli bacterium]